MIRENLVVLEANIDDANPQDLPPALDALLSTGALDAWITPCQMKKGRPGFVISALAPEDGVEAVAQAILFHTTTIGVRVYDVVRFSLERSIETVQTEYGPCRVKTAVLPNGTQRRVPEFEDIKRLAESSGATVIAVRAAVWKCL